MTGIRKYRRIVWQPSGTWISVADYIGRGAIRDIRLENLADAGIRVSGTDELRITVDRSRTTLTGGYIIGSGLLSVPYIRGGVGQYLNLAAFASSAGEEEPGIIISGTEHCINSMRIPFHENMLVEYYMRTSGSVRGSGMDITVLFEGKGVTGY